MKTWRKKVHKRRRGKEEKRWEGWRRGRAGGDKGEETWGRGEEGETIEARFNLGIKMRRSNEMSVP